MLRLRRGARVLGVAGAGAGTAARVQADPGQRIPLRRLPAGGAGAQRHRLGQPVRIHHGGAARSEEGRVRRQPRHQRLRAAARMRDPDRARARRRRRRGRSRPLARDRLLGPRPVRRQRVARRRTAAGPGRRTVAAHLAAGGRAQRPAARGQRRRAHARALAQGAAGRDDRGAGRPAGGRVRARAAAQRREGAALARETGVALSGAPAREHAGGRQPLHLQPPGDQVPVPDGDGAAGDDAGPGLAPLHDRRGEAALSGRRSVAGAAPAGARTAADRRLPLRDVLPDGARHRAVCARAQDPVPGPGLGRQFRGLLLPAHHGSGSGPRQPAVRALHQQGAQGAAGHRRRLRARAARGGDPVHLPQVRPRPRRDRRRRGDLPHPQRDPRRRQGAGPPGRAGRRLRERAFLVRRGRAAGAAAVPAGGRGRASSWIRCACASGWS